VAKEEACHEQAGFIGYCDGDSECLARATHMSPERRRRYWIDAIILVGIVLPVSAVLVSTSKQREYYNKNHWHHTMVCGIAGPYCLVDGKMENMWQRE
jgi:hypothetical protein